ARARARGGKGDAARAASELAAAIAKRGDEDRLAAADVLGALHAPAEWEVRREVYRARLAAKEGGAADTVGLAEALLHLGQKDEAVALLKKLVVRRLDDAEAYQLAAEEAEKWQLWPLARDFRRGLVSLKPRDGQPRLGLARDEK